MNDYKRLKVWDKSISLAVQVYTLISKLPQVERYGLSDQLRRAVVSISSNIAEGSKRNSEKEFAHFLQIAAGSTAEIETQLILVNKLYGLNVDQQVQDVQEVGKMLYSLIEKVRSER
jgi:four helix bundle protein